MMSSCNAQQPFTGQFHCLALSSKQRISASENKIKNSLKMCTERESENGRERPAVDCTSHYATHLDLALQRRSALLEARSLPAQDGTRLLGLPLLPRQSLYRLRSGRVLPVEIGREGCLLRFQSLQRSPRARTVSSVCV